MLVASSNVFTTSMTGIPATFAASCNFSFVSPYKTIPDTAVKSGTNSSKPFPLSKPPAIKTTDWFVKLRNAVWVAIIFVALESL